jgi:hypothetical protein
VAMCLDKHQAKYLKAVFELAAHKDMQRRKWVMQEMQEIVHTLL